MSPGNVRIAIALSIACALTQPRVGSAYEQHVDCGETDDPYTASDGTVFDPDQPYSAANGWGYIGGSAVTTNLWSPLQLVGTPDPVLYLTARWGSSFIYRFDVPDGEYLIRVRLAELEMHGAALRTFRCVVGTETIFDELDVWSAVEKDHAYDVCRAVTVTGGTANVFFEGQTDRALITAVSLISRDPDTVGPQAPDGISVLDGYARNLLHWEPPADADVAGYRIFRSSGEAGPFDEIAVLPYLSDHYFDDDVTAGDTRYYQVAAFDAYDNEGNRSAVLNATPLDSDASTLPVYTLTLDPDSLAILNADPYSDDFVHGLFATDDIFVPGSRLRYRGNSSRRFNKKGWKVIFPSGTLVAGRDRLNLVASYAEPSMLTNVVGFQLLGTTSVPTPQVASSHLVVNGVYRGVHAEMEQINDRFLDRNGLDEESSLYRAMDNLELLGSTAEYEAAYEKITNTDEGYEDLITFIETINTTSEADFPGVIASILDVDGFLDWYATEILIANDDFTHRDFFLHRDQVTGRWRILAWDFDSIMWNQTYHILTGTEGHPDFSGTNVLIDRMMEVPAYRYAFGQKLLAAIDGPFASENMDAWIDSAYAALQHDAFRDPYKLDHLDNSAYAVRPQNLRNFVAGRIAYLESVVWDHMPEVPGIVRINEFLAANDATNPDEFGEFDDWIELYNGTGAPISIEGMYLSDDLGAPTRYALPDTILDPGAFLVVWADDDTVQGPLHAPFKLNADGEEIGLFDRIENGNVMLDAVTFTAQTTDVSEGRFPDGSDVWQAMPVPTPGAANFPGGVLPPVVTDVEQYPWPVTAADTVWVRATVSADTTVSLAQLLVRIDDSVFVPTALSDDGLHQDGGAGDGVHGASILPQPDGSDVTWYIEVWDAAGGITRVPPGAPAAVNGYTVGYGIPSVRLNELLASNTSTNPDEAGDFDDWIELYNGGAEPVSLLGLTLTDDPGVPDRWALPDTSIAPGGHLLVWADAEPTEGILHAGFMLSAFGEWVLLFDYSTPVPVLVDSISFGPQTTDIAFGRFPDGDGPWSALPPTPGAPNTNEPLAIDLEPHSPPPVMGVSRVWPSPSRGPVSIRLRGPAPGSSTLSIYDVAGRRVFAKGLPSRDVPWLLIEWDGRDRRGRSLTDGIYFVRMEHDGRVLGRSHRLVIVR